MLSQISALAKSFGATLDRASKGFFICVNSKVIEKIASFPKLFLASRILALHYASNSSCFLMFVPQNFVVDGVWYVLTLAQAMEGLGVSQSIFLNDNLPLGNSEITRYFISIKVFFLILFLVVFFFSLHLLFLLETLSF